MTTQNIMAFAPELVLLCGALGLFVVSLGQSRTRLARRLALATSFAAIVATVCCLGQEATLFSGAYREDLFSQGLKVVFAVGFMLILLLSGGLAGMGHGEV